MNFRYFFLHRINHLVLNEQFLILDRDVVWGEQLLLIHRAVGLVLGIGQENPDPLLEVPLVGGSVAPLLGHEARVHLVGGGVLGGRGRHAAKGLDGVGEGFGNTLHAILNSTN